jgi:hypothetical protein
MGHAWAKLRQAIDTKHVGLSLTKNWALAYPALQTRIGYSFSHKYGFWGFVIPIPKQLVDFFFNYHFIEHVASLVECGLVQLQTLTAKAHPDPVI